MGLGIVHNDVVARHEGLNGRLATLVTEVEQERIFLLHEVGEFLLQGFVLGGLARHHSSPHGVTHAPLGRSFGVDLSDFRVVGKAEVVVDAPNKKLLASEGHAVADFSFKLGEGEVTVAVAGVLTQWSTLLTDSIKNVQKSEI